jgi:glycosyltransferase involved in cell wall biosynthesis
MQHVLIIGKVWPEPGSSAAGSRTMQLIALFMEQGWKVSFASASSESEFAATLDQGIAKYRVQINDAAFDDLLKTIDPTIVLFDRFTTEEQFGWRVAEHCPHAMRALDTIDLHCLRNARQEAVEAGTEFENADLLRSEVAKREIASIYRCDLSLMVSPVEMELLKTVFGVPAQLLYYLPLSYDIPTHAETADWPGFSERHHFLSIGNFLHAPNWDAVLYLRDVLWPLIRKRVPELELHVYGAYATQKVHALHNSKDGFLVKGRADNAHAVMSSARVCLAPLRFGAGIKGKLLDAMLCGTPTVTTVIGAEGMHEDLPWNGRIVQTPEEFAAASVELYYNEAEWKNAQKNGLTILRQIFSKQTHGAPFVEALTQIQNRIDHHRLQNFTGNMLSAQRHAATRYMSLWIEAKNKIRES